MTSDEIFGTVMVVIGAACFLWFLVMLAAAWIKDRKDLKDQSEEENWFRMWEVDQ